MKIVFEDKSIVVCIKPHGMLSQSDEKSSESAVNWLQELTSCPIYPVHRLDKATRGLMVFAKTKKAAAALSAQIASGEFIKEYIAIAHGKVAPDNGTLCDLLFFDRRANKSYVVKRERKGVKKAVLHYCTIEAIQTPYGNATKLYITLETGRTHQIRVQLASRGYPLLGDKRYGANDTEKQLALTAARLEFNHPESKEKLSFNIDE